MLDIPNNREAAMATPNRPAGPAPHAGLMQYLPLEKNFKDALKLLARFREAEGFRQYLRRRAVFVVPAVTLFALISIACAAGMVIFLAERHPMLALLGMALAPFVLAGNFFVEAFVFFSWLEARALQHALGRRSKESMDFGPFPQVPWLLAALFLILPLLVLVAVSFSAALVLILLAVGIVMTIAKFDR
jgi:hypothetical protein